MTQKTKNNRKPASNAAPTHTVTTIGAAVVGKKFRFLTGKKLFDAHYQSDGSLNARETFTAWASLPENAQFAKCIQNMPVTPALLMGNDTAGLYWNTKQIDREIVQFNDDKK